MNGMRLFSQRMLLNSIFLIAIVSLISCGSSTKTVRTEYDFKTHKNVYFMLGTASGATSLEQANVGNNAVSSNKVMSGEQQALVCAQNVVFEMRALGFNVVDKKEDADLTATFSIGTVRYDQVAGWIADQAFLNLTDNKTGQLAFAAKAQTKFVTPTTESLISNIIEQLGQVVQ